MHVSSLTQAIHACQDLHNKGRVNPHFTNNHGGQSKVR